MSARRCLVAGCAAEASGRRPICPEHYAMLPGKTRSRLSMANLFGRSTRHVDAFRRAAASLSGVAK